MPLSMRLIRPHNEEEGGRKAGPNWLRRRNANLTYRMANLRGRTIKMGVNMSPMQVANIAKAASSSPPKTSSRSHRLTAATSQQRSIRTIDTEACLMQGMVSVTRSLRLPGKSDSGVDQARGR
jgi:hypothetical protein